MEDFFTTLYILLGAAITAYIGFRIIKWFIHHHSDAHRSLNLVFLRIQMPKKESKEDMEQEQASFSSGKDFKEILGVAAHMFDSLHSIYTKSLKHYFTGQDFLSFEYVVINNQIYFYVLVPRELASLVEKQITGFYPDCYLDKVEDYNIFQPDSKAAGLYMELSKPYMFPIKSYSRLNSDPLNNLTNALSKLGPEDGAVIQILTRPEKDGWQAHGREEAKNVFNQKKHHTSSMNPISWISALFDFFVKGEIADEKHAEAANRSTPLADEEVKAMEEA